MATQGPVTTAPATKGRLTWPWLAAGLAGVLIAVGGVWYLRTTMAEAAAPPNPAPIDGNRAFGYLEQVCALGPHPAGSEANARVRELVAEHFRTLGGTVREQPFQARDPLTKEPVAMVNLVGSWNPGRKQRVVLGAHYDTRPFPDMEPDPAKRRLPFLGANDPGSGIAMLMELAHHLADSPTPWGVDLALFDGEELVYDQAGTYFLGSKEFGRRYKAEQGRSKGGDRYVAGLVFDMVGGRDLTIEKEPYSLELAPEVVREVWAVARALESPVFRDRVGPAVLDDHLSLNYADIPTIDLIDFDGYPQWHTADDLPAHCSAASLAEVGRVVTAWLAVPRTRKR